MKTITQGVYYMVPSVFFRSKCVAVSPKDDPRYKIEFGQQVTIHMISGTISTFPKLHVMLIVSKKPTKPEVFYAYPNHPEGNDDIIFMMNSGDTGGDNHLVPNLDIDAKELFLGYWAHNMNLTRKDFHANATIYYE